MVKRRLILLLLISLSCCESEAERKQREANEAQ